MPTVLKFQSENEFFSQECINSDLKKSKKSMEILGIIGPLQIILILGALFIFVIPWIIALIDILSNDFEGDNKLVWAVVIALTGLIGAILYFIIGTRQKISRKKI